MVVIQTHAERAHSWFSPSAASRILRCPGSVKACEGLPDTGGDAADDGTLCHEYMEAYFKGEDTTPIAAKMKSTKYSQPEAVNEAARQVGEFMEGLMMVHGDDMETQLEVKAYLPEDLSVFGTVDMVLWFPATSHLVVLDYKFGIGEVDAMDNDQLRTYASMLVSSTYTVAKTIELAVCQPRTDKQVKSHTYTRTLMDIWKKNVLMPGIAAAQADDAPLIPGAVQCKWCRRGKYGCLAAHQEFISVLGSEQVNAPRNPKKDAFDDLATWQSQTTPTLAKFADALAWLKIVLKNIEDAITNRMLDGETIEGYKLVNAVTRRRWLDEEKASNWLMRKGLKEADRYEKKLVSPSKAEKLVGFSDLEPRAQTFFRRLIEFPVGRPTFAPESDPRPLYKEEEPVVEEQQAAPAQAAPAQAAPTQIDISSLF